MDHEGTQRPDTPSTRRSLYVRIGISACALALLVLHSQRSDLLPADKMTIGLLIVAVLPWVLTAVEEAELPGGWKVKFRQVAAEQKRQAEEIESIKFLMRNFLTRYELEHLKKFAAPEPFWFDFHSGTKQFFERELRRMLDLSLIDRLPDTGLRALLYDSQGIQNIDGKGMKDVKKYLILTKAGADYLKMRELN